MQKKDKNRQDIFMIIENKTFDNERALYGSHDLILNNCAFDGPADGESALKECSNIDVSHIFFNLRYPCWHVHGLSITSSEMTEMCRAALWYSDHIRIKDSKLHGIKALRECRDVEISGSDIISPEFGWSVTGIRMSKSKAQSEYFMMRSEHIEFKEVEFSGKYSFQYIKDAVFDNCRFDTKDAFWHAEHVLVRDSVVKGEMPGRALKMILEWLEQHREELMENWEKAQKGDPLDRIAPLK